MALRQSITQILHKTFKASKTLIQFILNSQYQINKFKLIIILLNQEIVILFATKAQIPRTILN